MNKMIRVRVSCNTLLKTLKNVEAVEREAISP